MSGDILNPSLEYSSHWPHGGCRAWNVASETTELNVLSYFILIILNVTPDAWFSYGKTSV